MKNKKLYLGFIIPMVFWSTIIICGLMTENYNHLTNIVSELGRIGSKTQYIFSLGLGLSSILSIFFIFGLYKIAKKVRLNLIPILLIITFSFSVFGVAVFPLPMKLHGIIGSLSMFLPLSPLLTLILWRENIIPNIKIASGIMLIIMVAGFLIMMPNIMDNYMGLKQRLFHMGWTLWFIYLSRKFIELDTNLVTK